MSGLSDKDRKGLMLIAGVIAILCFILGLRVALDRRDKAGPDNCTGSVVRNTVILLDRTDQLNGQTQDEIVARATQVIRDEVTVGERVSVFAVSARSRTDLRPLISVCRPPADGNRAIEDVAAIRRRYTESFESPLLEILRQPSPAAPESSIAQSLTDLSLSTYLRGSANRLLVFSDMLEHTSGFSLYRCDNPSLVVERYRQSRRGARERPQFLNTPVQVHVIPRLGLAASTIECRSKLWPWFFGDAQGGGASVRFDDLPGGSPVTIQEGKP